MNHKKSRGQIWIETVLYTLIGLVLIGLVLAFATPKINEARDSVLIEQSISAMQLFGEKIDETLEGGVGTRTMVSLTIKKGELNMPVSEVKNSTLSLELSNLNKLYSESDQEIPYGRVTVKSSEGPKYHSALILLKISYPIYFCKSESDCSVSGQKLPAAATPYKFIIEKTLVDPDAPQEGIAIKIREAG